MLFLLLFFLVVWFPRGILSITCGDLDSNDPNVCHGGTCVDTDICECPNAYNYQGPLCQTRCGDIWSDDPNVCGGHGSCVLFDTCSCQESYVGSNCEDLGCNGIPAEDVEHVCSGNGVCQVDPNDELNPGTYRCFCNPDDREVVDLTTCAHDVSIVIRPPSILVSGIVGGVAGGVVLIATACVVLCCVATCSRTLKAKQEKVEEWKKQEEDSFGTSATIDRAVQQVGDDDRSWKGRSE